MRLYTEYFATDSATQRGLQLIRARDPKVDGVFSCVQNVGKALQGNGQLMFHVTPEFNPEFTVQ